MKSVLIASLFGALAAADYPPNFVNFRPSFGGGLDPPTKAPATAGAGKKWTGDKVPRGAGEYKAIIHEDQPLYAHTIVSPASPPPAGKKWSTLIYHNNGCLAIGWIDVFNIVQNIASFGYYVVVDGNVDDGFTSGVNGPKFSVPTDGFDAIDWVVSQAAPGKLLDIDAGKFGIAGTSCGGMQSYTTLQHPKAAAAAIISSGIFGGTQRAALNKINKPIGYFQGGPFDIGYSNGKLDYQNLTVPTTWASGPFGHGGGGQYMATAVATFFQWQLQGNETAKNAFAKPETSFIKSLGYNELESKNID